MKTNQTTSGIAAGDKVFVDGEKVTVTATCRDSDGVELVEISRPGYGAADNLVSLSSVKPVANTCHYCGMPAKTADFFGAPVCNDCGGK